MLEASFDGFDSFDGFGRLTISQQPVLPAMCALASSPPKQGKVSFAA